jgi:glucose-6-phosphate-specific signal transduction histidine kinase
LAERFEALLRAFNAPGPYARRLATRLRARARLAQRLAESAWREFRDLIGRTLHDALGPPIDHAGRVFAEKTS